MNVILAAQGLPFAVQNLRRRKQLFSLVCGPNDWPSSISFAFSRVLPSRTCHSSPNLERYWGSEVTRASRHRRPSDFAITSNCRAFFLRAFAAAWNIAEFFEPPRPCR
jgi:hypothetical protein